MKNITKTTIVSVLASSCVLASFSVAAHQEKAASNEVKAAEQEAKPAEQEAKIAEQENKPVEAVRSPDELKDIEKGTEKGTDKDKQADVKTAKSDCEKVCADNDEEEHSHSYRFRNKRDGFYVDVSAISSVGDDYAVPEHEDTDADFDVAMSYRVQILGLFMESSGISTRRIHGMYSLPSWGLNFYNSEDWSFDLFYQYSTRGIEGLEGIQSRNKDERAGLRMTGFFENSQLQAIYSPVSRNDIGSDGIEASISYSHSWQFRNWNYYTNLGIQYRSKEVTPFGQETYLDDDLSSKDGISYSAELGVEYPLTTDWVFGGYVGYNALSERAISQRQDNVEDGYRAGLLLTFIF
ncbi:MipA/OmpV family protein [Litorilituus sediminis]|uniref:MipA/OmpV family protein n=1 Tax=Litorilituus sediminis TaxID=718192 RepID=A0A4P6P743_9GAMM|nr:MipA/OmpV family protein [Litorilituus sediminis]QBG37344.1 hypothetical protein EMK97_17165 [Litorilituus sediminis]